MSLGPVQADYDYNDRELLTSIRRTQIAGTVRPQWELWSHLARRDQRLSFAFPPLRADLKPLSLPRLAFVKALQAAFGAITGSSRSASRYSMQNGESIGPSSGRPRGGGIAEFREP